MTDQEIIERQQATDKYCSAEYQRKVSAMVEREVIYCVSQLVHEMSQKDESFMDEFFHLLMNREEFEAGGDPDISSSVKCSSCLDWFDGTELDLEYGECADYFEDAGHDREVFEHWIVSGWLANQLEVMGEAVERDFYGLTIWGRATTGQSIAMDRVICDIYDNGQA